MIHTVVMMMMMMIVVGNIIFVCCTFCSGGLINDDDEEEAAAATIHINNIIFGFLDGSQVVLYSLGLSFYLSCSHLVEYRNL